MTVSHGKDVSIKHRAVEGRLEEQNEIERVNGSGDARGVGVGGGRLSLLSSLIPAGQAKVSKRDLDRDPHPLCGSGAYRDSKAVTPF